MLRAVTFALGASTALAITQCNQYTDCTSCLNPDLPVACGWCTPDPVVYANGSTGFQCVDQTEPGIICKGKYEYDGCVPGYVCNQASGQCVLGEPGEGDSQENCEKTCNVPPSPTPMYECNVQTFTCEESEDSSSSQSTCDANCADETPDKLVGLWRGLSVNQGFTTGEWVMNFSTSSVTYGTTENPALVSGNVATVGPGLLRITVTSPADQAGSVKYASYASPGYPTGPETYSVTIALQTDQSKQQPPQDVTQAMGDNNFLVFVMNACNSYDQVPCDFSSAFKAEAAKITAKIHSAKKKALGGKKASPKGASVSCSGFSDCESCTDGNAVCGWCDGIVYDIDGNELCGMDGKGCCGGNDGFSYCNPGFRKVCPVVCDYSVDAANPTCRAATTPEYLNQQTYDTCDDMPWCTTTYNYCDTAATTCAQAHSKEECDANPDCDSSNVNGCDSSTCKQISYIYCDTVLGCQATTSKEECDANPDCDSSSTEQKCDPTKCSAQTYYTCDQSSLQCQQHTGPFPTDDTYFNTTADCEASCVSTDLTGVWRGIQISNGFEKGEWDFKFTSTEGTYRDPSGLTGTATYKIGAAITPTVGYVAAEITLVLDDGTKLVGVVNNDRSDGSSKGPVTKFLYLALPVDSTGTVTTFDQGMSADEWVMIACVDTIPSCDFSSASP